MCDKTYDVACADCGQRYTQVLDHKPRVCGVCGSDFIAAREREQFPQANWGEESAFYAAQY